MGPATFAVQLGLACPDLGSILRLGSVRTTSVYLLGAPHETPVMSKLADFSIAEMPLFDYARLQEDVFALGRFVVRLLGKRARADAVIDAGDQRCH